MAAVALAIRLYTVDHGECPSELAALVPDYLAALPQDPFATDEASLGYKPLAERPLLYSVGYDGVDHGGEQVIRADHRRDFERSDIPFYLEPEPVANPEDGDVSGSETPDDNEDI